MKIKFIKIFSVITALLMLTLCLSSCGKSKKNSQSSSSNFVEKKTIVRVAALKGAGSYNLLKLMDDGKKNIAENDYKFSVFSSPDLITEEILSENFDIATLPLDVAAKLYSENKNISVIAISNLGFDSIVTNGMDISSLIDLKGKTICLTNENSLSDIVLKVLLSKNGLKVGSDVILNYSYDYNKIIKSLTSGTIKIAYLPQPVSARATLKNSLTKVSINISDEWYKAYGEKGIDLTSNCLIVRNKFLEENKEAVSDFLLECKPSCYFANEYFDRAAVLANEFGLANRSEYQSSFMLSNIVLITGEEMKEKISAFLNLVYKDNSSLIGAIPDESFYFIK